MMQADAQTIGDLSKTFAEKFPAQAKAIAEKFEDRQPDGAGPLERPKDEMLRPQQASEASALLPKPTTQEYEHLLGDNPASPWIAKIKTAHDEKECNAAYAAVPETLKQDVYSDYIAKLKDLAGRKKK
jgi:hypothetical protein